ncbi:putative nucleotidyltransferase [Aequorivita sublithincola DSM 14238]|uniref:Putative nucleotidyltransferase n=1 Tax=Aequorivita sublithincola (strain DSM 14238 / LMG 21431 / ACAM 643 / 9-3) TaxID=746697 RepID=I3YV90_AEQSU|nr:nucleotidyltransferase family protein [Aequorivita sublithincola]AFL80908.1 putative nucleotidyltransferase [Aequorivita sublithincola DSM 14238]
MDPKINKIIIETLLPFNPKQICVFGSYARGEMNDDSDIDILVDFPRGVTYLDMGGIYMDLFEKINRKIDLVTKDGLKPIYRPFIEEDLIEIYNAA